MFPSLKETESTGTNSCFNAAALSRVVSSLNLGCTRERERRVFVFFSVVDQCCLFRAFAGKGYFIFQFVWKYFIVSFFFSSFPICFLKNYLWTFHQNLGSLTVIQKQEMNSSIRMPVTSQRATLALQHVQCGCTIPSSVVSQEIVVSCDVSLLE